MEEAAAAAEILVRSVSFKASVQALRSWEPHLNQTQLSKSKKRHLVTMLYESITQKPIRDRPGRSEPRAIKRRPRNFQRLTKHRHEMKEVRHRNNYRKNDGGKA